MTKIKSVLKKIIPSVLLDIVRPVYRLIVGDRDEAEKLGEKAKEWYDDVYRKKTAYHQHYTESSYYFIWSVIADRLVHSGVERIIDVGCGPGQFASLLCDKKVNDYLGVDLSDEAIKLAQEGCSKYRFVAKNVFESDLLKQEEYDCFVSLECLEHLEQDIELLKMVKPGTLCLFTVPNFPYISHVRFFNDEDSVVERYGALFDDFNVETFLANPTGMKYFLAEGTKT